MAQRLLGRPRPDGRPNRVQGRADAQRAALSCARRRCWYARPARAARGLSGDDAQIAFSRSGAPIFRQSALKLPGLKADRPASHHCRKPRVAMGSAACRSLAASLPLALSELWAGAGGSCWLFASGGGGCRVSCRRCSAGRQPHRIRPWHIAGAALRWRRIRPRRCGSRRLGGVSGRCLGCWLDYWLGRRLGGRFGRCFGLACHPERPAPPWPAAVAGPLAQLFDQERLLVLPPRAPSRRPPVQAYPAWLIFAPGRRPSAETSIWFAWRRPCDSASGFLAALFRSVRRGNCLGRGSLARACLVDGRLVGASLVRVRNRSPGSRLREP